jgi:glucokinase
MTGRTAIGVDVGGTKIATALVDLDTGAILKREIEPTPVAAGRAGVMAAIIRTAERMLQQGAAAPIGIGIGLPELVDNTGCLL